MRRVPLDIQLGLKAYGLSMDGYSISQVAERTGFAPSALRYYEQAGLLTPDRTAGGYRRYDDHHIELLGFVGRGKAFGLTLDEITDVLDLLSQERCEPVQTRLKELVADKIADAQRRLTELIAFTAELRHVAASLNLHTPDGPCDHTCGCTTDRSTRTMVDAVQLVPEPTDAPIARAPSAPATCANASPSGDRSSTPPTAVSRQSTEFDSGSRPTSMSQPWRPSPPPSRPVASSSPSR